MLRYRIKNILPWRLQSKKNLLNANSNFIFRKIRGCKPTPCNPQGRVKYITLTCHRDVNICLLAMKSFLRFYSDVQMIVQDDGSLTGSDIGAIKAQVPNVQILSRKEADEQIEAMGLSAELNRLRNNDISFLKLIDVNAIFKGKRIVADSDVLFLREPAEIISWIESLNAEPFYHVVKDANKAFENKLQYLNRALKTNIDTLDYCSGFIGYSRRIPLQDIDYVSRILSEVSGVWGLEQNAYAFLMKEKSRPLPCDRYIAITEEASDAVIKHASMIHFIGKLKHKKYLQEGRNIIRQLQT